MKKQLLLLLTITLTLNTYSQITTYEKGYFITNSGKKTECLIKNRDWKNNPTEFEYKLTESSDKKKLTIQTIKEFGINATTKFTRHKVKIDRSSIDTNKLDRHRNPVLKEEELFLKVLLEGKSNLYEYIDTNLKRYFYTKADGTIEQLIYKRYFVNGQDKVAENNRYQQQLFNNLKCAAFSKNTIENINYKKNELVRFFLKYYECNNQKYKRFKIKQKRDLFGLTIRPGINSSSLSIENVASVFGNRDADFGNQINFRFGLEAEFILPFNRSKWGLFLEPTYQYFKSEGQSPSRSVNVDYKSIEFPFGVRHYLFLNENSKIFVNAAYFLLNANLNSLIDFEFGTDLEITAVDNNYAFGVGYKYNNKYSIEFRYHTNRELLGGLWRSDYKTLSVIAGYKIF